MRYVLTGRGQVVLLILAAALVLVVLTSVGILTSGSVPVSPPPSVSPSSVFPWDVSPSADISPSPNVSPSVGPSVSPSAQDSPSPGDVIVPSVSPSLPPVVSKDTLVFSFAHGQSALDADLLPLVDDFMKRAPERISVTTPPIPEADRIALLTLLSSETDGAVLIYGESGEPADGDFPVILKYIWESGK